MSGLLCSTKTLYVGTKNVHIISRIFPAYMQIIQKCTKIFRLTVLCTTKYTLSWNKKHQQNKTKISRI